MKYINELDVGQHISGIYLCKAKSIALSKNGREYGNLTLQDKTGEIAGKIWEPYSPGVRDFDPMDYVELEATVTFYNGANQLNIRQIRKAREGTYDPADYFPVSEYDIKAMQEALMKLVASVRDENLSKLLNSFYGDPDFMEVFSRHSAAKTIHHGFIGGLLQHTLSVAALCDSIARHYGSYIDRDLLVTGALLHDIGKMQEISDFPQNEYTDTGQLLGHIVMGAGMVREAALKIDGFPERLLTNLLHLIVSHHGELEYGSPKKPALIEAIILSYADIMDARVETMHEALTSGHPENKDGWLGYNKFLETNIRKTD